eukprot:CAMPEP_0178969204 /NCGR_PEP_ID=MMETSP0789-20121207/18711_1 /TAXON_ID=3005 /ORGANISM="Rhizosolenia setigera, Strain CCMP 1694" /LENGTH=543 /DNA_ID=CAMNT_0020655281 /DNA_START=24 /DNA_END=1655 /DNA_ORIENTATION=-
MSSSSSSSSKGLNVLFLSADTGGGHRASAESLGRQFELLFPGSTYTLMDVLADDTIYKNMKEAYKHMSSHPTQWKAFYHITNTKAVEYLTNVQLRLHAQHKIQAKIRKHNADVVVSVHPLMNSIPLLSCEKISEETGKKLPFFTVVTDLGSGHCQWFGGAKGVEKMFIASDQIRELAIERGNVDPGLLVDFGLPIRHDFAVQAEKLGKDGDRFSESSQNYIQNMRKTLGIQHHDRKTILIMGGGEGVGSLSAIVNAFYSEFVSVGIDANLLVCCGRNEKLRNNLETRDWDAVLHEYNDRKVREKSIVAMGLQTCFPQPGVTGAAEDGAEARKNLFVAGCIEGVVTSKIRRILSNGTMLNETAMTAPLTTTEEKKLGVETVDSEYHDDDDVYEEYLPTSPTNNSNKQATPASMERDEPKAPGKVKVYGLGFITNMADYMVSCDVIVTKAGPGTIAEAASLSLPVMLTSFLPGQEEGNIDFVVDGGFGAYCKDKYPSRAAEVVGNWLRDENKLKSMSVKAFKCGKPNAAANISKLIGDITNEIRR